MALGGGAGEGGRPRAQTKKGAQINEPTSIYFDKFWGSNGPQRGAKLGLVVILKVIAERGRQIVMRND